MRAGIIDTRVAVLEYNPRYERWEFFAPYAWRHVPKDAGFFWSPGDKCWMTYNPDRAARLIDHADPEAKAAITRASCVHKP